MFNQVQLVGEVIKIIPLKNASSYTFKIGVNVSIDGAGTLTAVPVYIKDLELANIIGKLQDKLPSKIFVSIIGRINNLDKKPIIEAIKIDFIN